MRALLYNLVHRDLACGDGSSDLAALRPGRVSVASSALRAVEPDLCRARGAWLVGRLAGSDPGLTAATDGPWWRQQRPSRPARLSSLVGCLSSRIAALSDVAAGR